MTKPCSKCGQPKTQSKSGRWRCRSCENAYQRLRYKREPEKMRKRKREHMAKARNDPKTREQYLEYQRKAWRNGGSEKRKTWMKKLQRTDRWRWKALTIHTSIRGSLSSDDLRLIFTSQDGKCGLTGRTLSFDDMHLDHKVPRSRGGGNEMENLRWVCSEANQAKHGLTDEEFLLLCTQVAEWIGRRIVEAWQ